MKIGPAEGSEEEIRDFFENLGLNPSEFFVKPEPALASHWLVIPAACFATMLIIVLAIHNKENSSVRIPALIAFITLSWFSLALHIRYKSTSLTTFAIILGIVALLLASGTITLLEVMDTIKDTKAD